MPSRTHASISPTPNERAGISWPPAVGGKHLVKERKDVASARRNLQQRKVDREVVAFQRPAEVLDALSRVTIAHEPTLGREHPDGRGGTRAGILPQDC